MTNRQKWTAFLVLAMAQFMLNVDTTIVNVALPSLQKAFNLNIEQLQWMVSAYILSFGGFLLLGGKTADLYGRRKVFLMGLAGFTAASLFIGITPFASMIIPLRGVQGLSGAFMMPSALSMVLTLFEERAVRTKALSIWTATAAVGGTSGLLIGGILTQYLSWRWNFLINVPVGGFVFFGAWRLLPPFSAKEGSKKLDVSGAVLVTSGLMLLVYTITNGKTWGWASFSTIGHLVASFLLIAGFIFNETRASHPIMPLSIFRMRNIASANGLMLVFSMTTLPTLFFLTLYNQGLNAYAPFRSGLACVPIGVVIFITAMFAPRFIKLFGFKRVLLFAPLTIAIGSFLFAHLPLHLVFITQELPGIIILSLGMGVAMVTIIVAATSGIPVNGAGLASGMTNTFQQVGGSVGIAILASAASAKTAAIISASPNAKQALAGATLDGYHNAFYIVMWLAIAVSVLASVFIRETGDEYHPGNKMESIN